MSVVLFLDDDEALLRGLRRLLRMRAPEWRTVFESSVDDALRTLEAQEIDAVVSDYAMPGKTGFDLLEAVHRLPDPPPVIIMTGCHEADYKRRALDLGAADLLNKPVNEDDLIARVNSVLRLRKAQKELRSQNSRLEILVQERTAELQSSRLELAMRLATAAECRDQDTGEHIVRVGLYAEAIAEAYGLPEAERRTLLLASPLHDIGKLAVPDSILRKPGALTPEERLAMQEHALAGHGLLIDPVEGGHALLERMGIQPTWGSDCELIQCAALIALTHHERYDGRGYPSGTMGELIPLCGRIVAVADVYDALRSPRPYKGPLSSEESLAIMRKDVGSHFDPKVFDAFERAWDRVMEIDRQHRPEAAGSLRVAA